MIKMHQSPKLRKKSANVTNPRQNSTSFQKEEAAYEYCDELFQNVETNDKIDISINKCFEDEADEEENVFAQCHQHLHSINLCVEYQQTIKDEMKKLAKLEHAIYQKTSSHAQRMSQIASTLSPDQETEWITQQLNSLADQVARTAQAHHKNAITLSSHCNAIQQALDSHHDLMRSIHSRNLNKTSAHSDLQSSPTARNAGVVVALSDNPRRIPSPRKTTTLSATKEGKANQSLKTAGMHQSPRREILNGTSREADQGEITAGKEKERARMTFLHAYCLFEDIRKPRLILANRIEYLRTQQISIMQQLQDEDGIITCLRETTHDKSRPWYAQVRLEECLSLKEFLGEHGRQLDNHMTEAMHALEAFDFQHRDKLADILKVFALHRFGHYSNLKRTLMLMKCIFLEDETKLQLNPTGSDEVMASSFWLPTEDYYLVTMDTHPNKCAEDTESIKRPATVGNCDVELVKKPDCNKLADVAGDMLFEHAKARNVDFCRSEMLPRTLAQNNTPNVLAVKEPAKCIETANMRMTDKVQTVSKGLQSQGKRVEFEDMKQGIPRTSSYEFDDKIVPSNEPENSSCREQQEAAHTLVDISSTPSPKQDLLLRKDLNDMKKVSPLRSNLKISPKAALGRNEQIDNSTSFDSLNSETQDCDDGDRSSSVDGTIYQPRVSSRPLFSTERHRPTRKPSRGIRLAGENVTLGKSPGERDSRSSSVDCTNNHELAMLSKYIPSQRLSSHEELAVRDVSQLYRQKSKERLLNLSEDQHSLVNKLDREFDEDDSDLKALKYIGKYVTNQRRESLVGRDPVKNKYPFRNLEPFNKNGNSHWPSNGIKWDGQSRICRRADDFSETFQSCGILKDKDLCPLNLEEYKLSVKNINPSSSKKQTRQTDDKIEVDKNRKNNNANMEKSVCSSDFFIISSPTNKHVLWTSDGCCGEPQASTETNYEKKKENKNTKKTGENDIMEIPANEASNQNRDSQRLKVIQCEFSQKGPTSICRWSAFSSPEVTPNNKQSFKSENYAEAVDDSEWETESMSTLTSVSLASCGQVPSQRSRIQAPARAKVSDLTPGSRLSRNSQESARNVAQNSKTKVSKKVCFDDKVQYNK